MIIVIRSFGHSVIILSCFYSLFSSADIICRGVETLKCKDCPAFALNNCSHDSRLFEPLPHGNKFIKKDKDLKVKEIHFYVASVNNKGEEVFKREITLKNPPSDGISDPDTYISKHPELIKQVTKQLGPHRGVPLQMRGVKISVADNTPLYDDYKTKKLFSLEKFKKTHNNLKKLKAGKPRFGTAREGRTFSTRFGGPLADGLLDDRYQWMEHSMLIGCEYEDPPQVMSYKGGITESCKGEKVYSICTGTATCYLEYDEKDRQAIKVTDLIISCKATQDNRCPRADTCVQQLQDVKISTDNETFKRQVVGEQFTDWKFSGSRTKYRESEPVEDNTGAIQ